ncbi:MAG: SpoIIIAH-like family protein [Clostridia bacterium]|nr:SpoIIIAH-like family protein [Clostridia bacterium]
MSKGKVFTKGQVIAFLMVVCLAAAIFLNVKFTSTGKYLGEATYVSKNTSSAVKTSSKNVTQTDYFEDAKNSRKKAYTEAENKVKELLDTDKLTETDKKEAMESIKSIALNMEKANNIETILIGKGFKNVVAVLTPGDASIVVKSDGLNAAQTMQIQEVVTTQTGINLANIKIVTVK